MQDLNDLYYFAQVVAHGGFAPAGRALNIPKSKLSRRVAQLEERLNARLIERSSRRFRVTEIGQAFHEQAQAAVAAADRAQALVEASLSEPRGQVNFSCPSGLVELVAPMLPDFLCRYPRVKIRLLALDRPVDLIAEGVDVALRVRVKLETDAALTMRTLAHSRRILVASPAIANRLTSSAITALAELPTLSTTDHLGDATWILEGPGGVVETINHKPRLACGSFLAVRDAAVAHVGVALLPDHTCAEALRAGQLVRILPDWAGQDGIVHLVFTTRTGLPPHVRAWIDHLAQRFKDPALFAPVLASA
jgi:DNA-binding transcriptional LysR family regulator